MDNQAYLNQISAPTQKVKTKKSFLPSSPIFKTIIIGVAALIFVWILGLILSNTRVDIKAKGISLKLRLDNTVSIISEYQPSVKTSSLRSASASLSTILSSTSTNLANYLTEKYNFSEKSIDEKTKTNAESQKTTLQNELFEAKINGLLDRTYARKMAYEISIIANDESEIIKSINNEDIKSKLESSYRSLSNLYETFNSFSETK